MIGLFLVVCGIGDYNQAADVVFGPHMHPTSLRIPSGIFGLSAAVGLGLLQRGLACAPWRPVLAPGAFDWARVAAETALLDCSDLVVRSQEMGLDRYSDDQQSRNSAPAAPPQNRTLLHTPAPRPRAAESWQAVQDRITGIASQILGAAPEADTPLMAAGLDSLGSVEFQMELSAAFGLQLGPTVALDFPTVAALARHIAQALQEQDDDEAAVEDEEIVMPDLLQPSAPTERVLIAVASLACRYPGQVDCGELWIGLYMSEKEGIRCLKDGPSSQD